MLPEGLEILSEYFVVDEGSGESIVKDDYAVILGGERVIVCARDLEECAWKANRRKPVVEGIPPILSAIEVFRKIDIGSK